MADIDQDELLAQSVGERLRLAREAKGLSLEDVARQTRIPIRHLEHIEREEWDALPAITYSVGFARSYANTIDLDGAQIGAEVRQQLGGARLGGPATAAAYYEPADPARVPPRSVAIAAILIVCLLGIAYLVWRSGAADDSSPADVAIAQTETPSPAAGAAAPSLAAPAPSNGPVVLSAVEDVWLRIDQAGGAAPLYLGILKAGQSYRVPAGAQAPRLRTARANMLQVSVGGARIPPLGPAETTIANVSLAPADLVARAQGGGAAPPAAAPR